MRRCCSLAFSYRAAAADSVFERSFFTVQLCWGDFNLGQRRIKVFCITLPRKLRSFLSSSFLLESVLKKSSSNWFDSHVQIFFLNSLQIGRLFGETFLIQTQWDLVLYLLITIRILDCVMMWTYTIFFNTKSTIYGMY